MKVFLKNDARDVMQLVKSRNSNVQELHDHDREMKNLFTRNEML
jgi:hypothetical protein